MKKIFVMAISAAALLASCGVANKPASSEAVNPYGPAVAAEPCIELYEQSPYNRAYGNGQHFKESTARNIAELQARAMFASKIETAVSSATKDIGIDLTKYSGNNESGQIAMDQSAGGGSAVKAISHQILRNTHTIKTSRYFKSNNQFTVFVCMEYGGDKKELVNQIEQTVKDMISPEDRAKLEQRHDQFEQSLSEDLKK